MKGAAIFLTPFVLSAAWSWRTGAPLPAPRAGYAAGVRHGEFVIAGGSYWSHGVKMRTADVSLYNPKRNHWRAGPAMPVALSDVGSASIGETLYVLGGSDSEAARGEVYALTDAGWKERADLRLPAPRMNGAAASDGKYLFYAGGLAKFGDYQSAVSTVWMIDSENPYSGWLRLPDCPGGPRFILAAAALKGKLYLFGGARAAGAEVHNLSDVWMLDWKRRVWTRRDPLPEPRRAMWAALERGGILLFAGYTDVFRNDILYLDPRNGSFRKTGEIPQPIADAKFCKIGKTWYTAGGEVGPKIRGTDLWLGEWR